MTTARKEIQIDRVRVTARGKRHTYHADFSYNGQHCRKSLKTTNLKLAKQRAQQLNAELTLGGFRETAKRWTIAESVAEYLHHGQSVGKAPGTLSVYRGILEAHRLWCAERGWKKLQQLSVGGFEKYLRELREANEPITVHNHAIVIKQWVKWAAARGHLNEHVLRLCSLRKPPHKPRFVPTLENVWAILKAAPEGLGILFAVLAMTGMRCGELRHLQVEDIDFETGWIAIVSRPGRETKTRASRRVPLHPALRPLLQHQSWSKSGFAFCAPPSRHYPLGTHSLNTVTLNQALGTIAVSLGLPVGRQQCGTTLHTFRRFFETHLVNAGIPQRCIDQWLGHTSDRSMGAVYYTLTDDQSQSFMKQINFACPASVAEPQPQNP